MRQTGPHEKGHAGAMLAQAARAGIANTPVFPKQHPRQSVCLVQGYQRRSGRSGIPAIVPLFVFPAALQPFETVKENHKNDDPEQQVQKNCAHMLILSPTGRAIECQLTLLPCAT